jgi:hypothetical protein
LAPVGPGETTNLTRAWTPALTLPQTRLLIAWLLHDSLEREHPGWELGFNQRRAVRKDQAYAGHHIARGCWPPLHHQRRQ